MISSRKHILVTGGAGFIGSHFVRLALEAGSNIVVLDDLSGSRSPRFPEWMIDKPGLHLAHGDIGDRRFVRSLMREHAITSVVHFAGKTSVGESVSKPELYFDHNLLRTHALLEATCAMGMVFLFSSSAAVYGTPNTNTPISETAKLSPISPYGMSKLGVEHALEAYGVAHGLRWGTLRYFNAAGAHSDGTMREEHHPETHLIPLAIDAALRRGPPLVIFGDDHGTPDGTCLRDYVHVCDVAQAHLSALDALDAGVRVDATNIGRGRSASVMEVVHAVGHVLGETVPFTVGPKRQGDPAYLLANTDRAAEVLGWRARYQKLDSLIVDAVRSREDRKS